MVKKQAKKPTKKDLEALEKGLSKAGMQAMKESVEGIPPEARKLAKRLDKLDAFIAKLVKEEGKENIDAQAITEMLMVKARHNAFVHTDDTNPNAVLLWLINIVLFNADAVFAATKSHLLAQEQKE